MKIGNINRVFGTIISNEISKLWGSKGLPNDTVKINLEGSAGQSFGAWITKGMTLNLEGDANDFVGKGLSGGKIIIYPPKDSHFVPEENILLGNVALYGATDGEAYFRGIAAERFCVRNSGARVVVEGIGDHGCEYMTGGRAVILGETGRNFGAGMSGGIAYVYNPKGSFIKKCNTSTFELEDLVIKEDINELKELISNHYKYTKSSVAEKILLNWTKEVKNFSKVMPTDYKRVLQEMDTKKIKGKLENGKVTGFKEFDRAVEPYRPAKKRILDFKEIYTDHDEPLLGTQASRCMNCGVPFCQSGEGCPVYNLIPEWNDLVYNEKWEEAFHRLMKTNNFPEVTGRVCPAVCEGACVLGITETPVAIKNLEFAIADKGIESGWIKD